MKKIISMLLMLCLMAGCFCGSAFAAETCAHGVDGNSTDVCENCVSEIQALVDDLPAMEEITDSNKDEVAEKLGDISRSYAPTTDATRNRIDFTKFNDASFVLNTPDGCFRFAVNKAYESGVNGPDASFVFLDESATPATILLEDTAIKTSIDVSANGASVRGYLPEGTYSVSETVEGSWTLSLTVNGNTASDLQFSGQAGNYYIMTASNTLNPVPNILTPESDDHIDAYEGEPVEMLIETNQPFNYQWYKDDKEIENASGFVADGDHIEGENYYGYRYTIDSAKIEDSGKYYCKVWYYDGPSTISLASVPDGAVKSPSYTLAVSPITYTVNLTASPAEGGTVSQSGNGTYKPNDKLIIKAIPKAGYRFVKWISDGDTVFSTEAELDLSPVDRGYYLTAVFEPVAPASSVPATGDMSNVPLWTALLILFAAAVILTRKKKA